MNALLKVLHQKDNIDHVQLQPTTTVGRSPDCDLKISSCLVSRLHCRFILRDGAVYVEDLGSSNGTYLDEELLTPHEPTAANPGAKVAIGPAEFLVDYVAPTANSLLTLRSDVGESSSSDGSPSSVNRNAGAPFTISVAKSTDESAADSQLAQQKTAESAVMALPRSKQDPAIAGSVPPDDPPVVSAPKSNEKPNPPPQLANTSGNDPKDFLKTHVVDANSSKSRDEVKSAMSSVESGLKSIFSIFGGK